jgi:hypothetical protein
MRLALLLACLPLAAQANPNGGLSQPFLGAPGTLTAWDIMPGDLPEGRWDWGAVPGYGFAAVRGARVSPGLADAVATITCAEGRGGPEMNVMVNYWIADPEARQDEPSGLGLVTGALTGDFAAILPAPEVSPDDMYTIDLFNSMISGRPASYDIGEGEVSTTGVSFPFNEAPPQAYHDAVAAFYAGLRALPPDGRVILRFVPQRDLPEVKLALPLEGLQEALDGVEQRSNNCP